MRLTWLTLGTLQNPIQNANANPAPPPANKAKGFIPAVVILAVLNALIIAAVIAAFVFVSKKKKREADPFRSASVAGTKQCVLFELLFSVIR